MVPLAPDVLRRGLLLRLRRLRAGFRPRLVELDSPLPVLGLRQREPRPEALTGPAFEARHRLLGATGLDQLARDRYRQLLARLRLPDHESAARILTRPARVALAVLHDVAAAHRARAEVGAGDPDVLELGVELGDGALGELDDVPHDRF